MKAAAHRDPRRGPYLDASVFQILSKFSKRLELSKYKYILRYRPEEAQMRPHEEYEFPCGTKQDYGIDRFRIPEPIFNPRMVDNKSTMLGAAHLIT